MQHLWVFLVIVGVFVLNVLFARWVYEDAKRRGLRAGFWCALVTLTPGAWLIYLLHRKRKGNSLY